MMFVFDLFHNYYIIYINNETSQKNEKSGKPELF
jgi:hypothetical protein